MYPFVELASPTLCPHAWSSRQDFTRREDVYTCSICDAVIAINDVEQCYGAGPPRQSIPGPEWEPNAWRDHALNQRGPFPRKEA